MIKIGLTGGIGAGKSTVSSLFKERGFPVFNSDICAREAEKKENIQLGFKRIIDDNIFINGELDRERLRGIIFTDKDKLKQVNQLITPYVKAKFEKFCLDNESDHAACILESAILFETDAAKNFDYIITVTASENTRIQRVLKRDGISVEMVLKKLGNQLPEVEKVSKSNFVVINDGYDIMDSLELLTRQVDAVVKAIKYDLLMKKVEDLEVALNDYKKISE